MSSGDLRVGLQLRVERPWPYKPRPDSLVRRLRARWPVPPRPAQCTRCHYKSSTGQSRHERRLGALALVRKGVDGLPHGGSWSLVQGMVARAQDRGDWETAVFSFWQRANLVDSLEPIFPF
jgi:hypothetical protein